MDSDGVTATDPTDIKVGELLKEVVPDNPSGFSKLVDDTVSTVKDVLAIIPTDVEVPADEVPKSVTDMGADKVGLKYKKSNFVEIGGSYSIQCVTKPELNVDLFVRLPKECFQEKDYLNYRYHAKRCLYLCIIKKYLKLKAPALRVEWSTLQNEARKPVLHVFPAETVPEFPGFFVRIIPTAPSLFSISKLNLERNNVRALNQGDVLQPTPIYNSSILEDMFLEENVEFVKKTFHGWRELREALILLKVWARQRSSIHVHDCLNGFLISFILAYLATHDKINNSLKAIQIVRITLDFIATSKLWSRGLYVQQQGQNCLSKEVAGLSYFGPLRCAYVFSFLCAKYHPLVRHMLFDRFGYSSEQEIIFTLQCLSVEELLQRQRFNATNFNFNHAVLTTLLTKGI